MMTKQECIEFAVSSAYAAFDQRSEYADAIASHRDNVRDTLNDERSAQHEPDAFDAFDAVVAKLSAAK
jgi:hypothetical protein